MKTILRRMEAAVLAVSLVAGAGAAVAPGEAVQAASKKPAIRSFKVTAPKKTLYLGWTKAKKSTTLKVKIKPKKASKKVTFRSSNKKVATVSKKGKVTAKKVGKVTITVTSKSQKKWKKKVKLTVKNCPMKFSKKTYTIYLQGTSDVTEQKLTLYGTEKNVTYSSSNTDVATVTKKGKVTAKKLGTVVVTARSSKGKKVTCNVEIQNSLPSIHDPSVYRDPKSNRYYSFGSHVRAAVSTNLIGWSTAAGSGSNYSSSSTLFQKAYSKEFAEAYAYTMPKGAAENAWAPDVIYNTSMKKYCMYISIVDGSTKCCIAMATADKPDGPYSYRGMLVCSGMNTDGSDMDKTNVASALGLSAAQAKISKYAALGSNSPDCIDPTVFYDHEGKLWMVYGSFTTTGGIRLLKLNPATGLRGDNYADSGDGGAATLSTDDPYYGKKIANSNGEGPYIQMLANPDSPTGYYYYLWTSVGNLQYYGGYNMRVVRADRPEGPYYDTKGNEATKDLQKYALGLRVMDNYKFSFMDSAFVSQGGNSATDDGKGKTFIQFHARTSSSDSYSIRTHQTFVNEDGWLVTAPYEYNGETIAESYDRSAVVGDYEFFRHREGFAKTTIANKDILESERVTLLENGNITGACTGTWRLQGHDITIETDGQTYKGVVLEQYEQTDKREKVMVFTAVGDDNRSVWGSRMHKDNDEAVAYDLKQLVVPETADRDFAVDSQGLFGSRITWTTSNTALKVENGKAIVTKGSKAQTVTLMATVVKGNSKKTKKFTVKIPKGTLEINTAVQGDRIELPQSFGGEQVTWASSDTKVIALDGVVTQPLLGYKKVTLTATVGNTKQSFEVVVLPKLYSTVLYEEDYSSMVSDAAIATTWTSVDKQNCLYAEADATHDSFIKFAAGNTSSSQGAQTLFGIGNKARNHYAVTFDVALEAGDTDVAEFALTGTDVKFRNNDTNAGLESGYVFKLSAPKNNTSWSINDSAETFELPITWVTVTAVVDVKAGTAAVMIADKERQYYGGEVKINGTGKPNGLYLRWARKQSLVSVDNVKVYH